MANVHDIGAFIQRELAPITAVRLQKLAYYAQAWSLAWDGQPLFREVIKAWRDGPVCPELWHGGQQGDPTRLSQNEQETVRAVIEFYNRFTDAELIELTHREKPWRDARAGLVPNQRGTKPITLLAIRDYYRPPSARLESAKRIPEAVRRGVWFLLDTPPDELEQIQGNLDAVAGDSGSSILEWLETGEGDPWAEDPRE